MSLTLTPINQKIDKIIDRPTIEGEHLFKKLLSHDNNLGAQSSITFGQPGSCKTSVTCAIADYFLNLYDDKVFWRNPLHAPFQFMKLKHWHIWLEEGGGIRVFNRHDDKDITDILENDGCLSYFKGFDTLLKKSEKQVCNGVFFRDVHEKGVKNDKGTVQWFSFIRYLLESSRWYFLFIDEYQEMVKQGNMHKMWHHIDDHSNDVSTARKANVGIHVNCHQTTEIDYRVLSNIMMVIQLYGSRVYSHSPVTKQALNALPKPNEKFGAVGWISEGGTFGKLTFPHVFKLHKLEYGARILNDKEDVAYCLYCNEVFVKRRKNQFYCCDSCTTKASLKRREKQKTGIISKISPSLY